MGLVSCGQGFDLLGRFHALLLIEQAEVCLCKLYLHGPGQPCVCSASLFSLAVPGSLFVTVKRSIFHPPQRVEELVALAPQGTGLAVCGRCVRPGPAPDVAANLVADKEQAVLRIAPTHPLLVRGAHRFLLSGPTHSLLTA